MHTHLTRAAAAAAAALLVLSGCGGSDDDADDAEEPESSQSSAPAATQPAEPTTAASEPGGASATYPTEAGEVALPGNVRIAGLDLGCTAEPSEFGGSNGTVSITGTNTTDVEFGRLRIDFEVTGGGEPAAGYTNLPAFLPDDELAYVVPTTLPEGASGCEITGVEGTQPAEAPPVSFDTDGAVCEVTGEETTGYWNYRIDTSGIADFPAEGASVSVAFLSKGRIFGYQEPSLAAGETTSSDVTTTIGGRPTCEVKVFTLP